MKEGSRRFENIWEPEAKYPLHIVAIDHETLDIDVKDDETGSWLGRPWLTIGIDVYSRMVWGMHVSLEPPSGTFASENNRTWRVFEKLQTEFRDK